MKLTVSAAILRSLADEGVSSAFGIASGKLGPIFRALSEQTQIRFVGTRHEAAAAHMAAAVAAGTGQIAVALGELGPGGSNLTSGIASAYANSLPMIVITSSNALHISQPSRGMMMELNLVRLFEPITRFSQCIYDPRRAPEVIQAAIRAALGGRPGPVHVSVPADLLGQIVDYDEAQFPSVLTTRATGRSAADLGDLTDAARLLAAARRPLLIAGGGVVASGAEAAIIAIAERLGAPATATQMGIGAVPDHHASFIGHGGVIGGPAIIRALREADVILAVGCRFSSWLWQGDRPDFAADARLIHIDTDPQAIGRVVPATIGMVADARSALERLTDALDALGPPQADADWLQSLREDRRNHLEMIADGAPLWGEGAIHPARLTQQLRSLLPDDAMVVYDGGHTSFWSNDILSAPRSRMRFHEPGLAVLGFGLPYANALQSRFPDRLVVNVTGDGSMGFTLQELDTARRYGLNVVNVIHNNAAWGVIRAGQKKADFEFATSLEDTDYAAIARGFGCHGETVYDLADFAAAFARARASGKPAVLDCHVSFVPHPCMANFAAIGARQG